ncbi:M28 family peptidase [Psychrosphaera sp. B3R10]|uniref:M28 family metallopeptidase n=2 Tax=Psychrosphaera TaxID=907197 RepID=UPI001C09BBF2|nr:MULTISPECIES: M28 family metallopeptidase [unclassified Psychrosphaera]MBU2880988.1 M28 family peptidase [Psychrosphaera sp. I2R16]MBU2990793.1 M28 family peptidase [Psychrosphaera sp. B3R10]MDO6720489.1 M28 family metallopeptidase [Psychrosphaera sp. 1_MG-2023]
MFRHPALRKWIVALSVVTSPLFAANDKMSAAYLSISDQDLATHVKEIASDKYMGRLPTGPGEQLMLDYLTTNFKKYGFQPGNGDSFLQPVDLVEIVASEDQVLTLGNKKYQFRKDMVMGTSRTSELEKLKNSELVFVGYGINAPEYNWNDYANVDMKGKTAVILVNDPGFESGDDSKFQGKTMTYYGRWTYKYEEASRQGAAGAIIIHETAPASYGWSVVENSWTGPQYGLWKDDGNKSRVAVEGWIQRNVAVELFNQAGLDFETYKKQAMKKPTAVNLSGLKASVVVNSKVKKSTSYNFIATLPGAKRPDEHIIYTAHWDHIGFDDTKKGDKIYNGAHDNATGIAGLLELGQAFSILKNRPDRSITVLAVTAEEQGLLGSKFYAENPIIPLNKSVANINMDSLNILGKVKEVAVQGLGKSELDNYLTVAAAKQNRTLIKGKNPSAGYYYRSDHFNFAKVGVPALYAGNGETPVDEKTAKYSKKMKLVVRGCYHQPCDEYRRNWDLTGAQQDVQLFFDIGYSLSTNEDWPKWSKTSEFQRSK